ncbi:MAG: hypothetical protein AB9828_06520 [Sphaerochaetaceae bacterium]
MVHKAGIWVMVLMLLPGVLLWSTDDGQYSTEEYFLNTDEGNWFFEGDQMTFEGTDGSGLYISTSGPLCWPEELAGIPQPEAQVVLQMTAPGYYSYVFSPLSFTAVESYIGQLEAKGFSPIDAPQLSGELVAGDTGTGPGTGTEGESLWFFGERGAMVVLLLADGESFTLMFQPVQDLQL